MVFPTDQSRGFTLIEILTVIAIIAVLAALLYPALQSAMKQSWTAQDINSLRQIGCATQLYANDHDNTLPNNSLPIPGTKLSSGEPDRYVWQEAVDRYLPRVPGFAPGSAYNFLRRKQIWLSKFAQAYPGWAPAGYGEIAPFAFGNNTNVNSINWLGRTTRIPYPSQIVLAGEVNNSSGFDNTKPPVTVPDKQTGYRACRPGNSALYLFCDFHIVQLAGDQSEPALKTAGKPNIWRWW